MRPIQIAHSLLFLLRFSFGGDGYCLICFDSELLSVGVLGEVDVEAGVVAFGETVLDLIYASIVANETSVFNATRRSDCNTFFWSLSISCDSFRVRSATCLAGTVRCDSCGDDVGYHKLKVAQYSLHTGRVVRSHSVMHR